jgi:hypothetical protein
MARETTGTIRSDARVRIYLTGLSPVNRLSSYRGVKVIQTYAGSVQSEKRANCLMPQGDKPTPKAAGP